MTSFRQLSDVTERRSFVGAAQMTLNALHQRLFDQTRFARLIGQWWNGRSHHLMLLLLKVVMEVLLLRLLQLLMLLVLLVLLVLLLEVELVRRTTGTRHGFTAQASVEFAPGIERLVRPDPESGRDAYHQRHEVLEHENGEIRPDAAVVPGASSARQCTAPFLVQTNFVCVAAQ